MRQALLSCSFGKNFAFRQKKFALGRWKYNGFLENSNNHQWPGLCIRDPSGALERFSKGFKRALFKKILHFVKYILHFRGVKKFRLGYRRHFWIIGWLKKIRLGLKKFRFYTIFKKNFVSQCKKISILHSFCVNFCQIFV